MQDTNTREIISEALDTTNEMNPQATDGTWLEDLTVQVGPYLREWDIDRCYPWSEWPEREDHFPKSTNQDVGIDAVAVRLEDNQFIAIQCKARQLDEHGNGAPIEKSEIDKFASASADDFWAERWIVTNGNHPLSNNAQQVLSMTSKPIKLVNITNELLEQQTAPTEEECPHCAPNPESERRQTPGWFGYGSGEESQTDPAYSRVTNPERFRPLHTAMLAIIDRLESDFEVERAEGFSFDEKLARGLDLARADVRLTPRDSDAAPISVVFTTFPGLRIRFGRWYIEPFPDCGCDACDESAEGEIERLNDMVDDVTAGRFREAIEIPLISFMGAGWVHKRFWSPDGRRTRGRSRVDRRQGLEMSGGRRRLDLNWKPWPHRQ